MSKSKLPTIDVITPVYNRARYLEALYFSIAKHKIIRNWIVIDDDSDDCPGDIIAKLPKNSFLNIIYKKIEKSGFNVALNKGFGCISSDYCMKVDSDDLLHPNFTSCIEKVYRLLVEQSRISAVYGFSFRTSDSQGNLIGKMEIPEEFRFSICPPIYLADYSYVRLYSKRSYGDLLDIFQSSFIKNQFRYPIFGDEVKCPTSMLHTSCALHYSKKCIAYVDIPLLEKNYLPGGITCSGASSLRKNPKSYLLLALQHLSFPVVSIKAKVSICKTIIRAVYYIIIGQISKALR